MDACNRLSCSDHRIIIPEKHRKAKRSDQSGLQMQYRSKNPGSSGNSSCYSTNVPSEVVDRYVDVDYSSLKIPTRKESVYGYESSQRLAKNVIKRLAQTSDFPRTDYEEFERCVPVTVEDIYGGSLDKVSLSVVEQETIDGFCKEKSFGFLVNSYELQRKHGEAEERVSFLLKELGEDHRVNNRSFDVPTLVQTIRRLKEEKLNLAREVSEALQCRIAERASINEEMRAELEMQTRKLEEEMDRRSTAFSLKLEKYKVEDKRLRERVRELAEQNVSLQREVCSISKREMEIKSSMTSLEQELQELTTGTVELSKKNEKLQREVGELREKCRVAEENGTCFRRNLHEKEEECKELQKTVTRLLRTKNHHEKTIDGLIEELHGDWRKLGLQETVDNLVAELRTEQITLMGTEHALRNEVGSYKQQIDGLRTENISLLRRLNGTGGYLNVELDKEMQSCVCCLQTRCMSMLNESTDLCSKLLEFIKTSSLQDTSVKKSTLDGEFILECDMKVQGFKRGSESLTQSLQTMSSILQKKARSSSHDDVGSVQSNDPISQDKLGLEVKTERLITTLLREKLRSKHLEIEQLQAEISTVVQGNNTLRNEIQNTLDNLSCALHKLKELELQMLKKEDNLKRLQTDLQDTKKQLIVYKDIVPKITQERNLMWDEVKQYSEQKMLLNLEVDTLKKKISALNEDMHLKEGQISLLKDSLNERPFCLLDSLDFT